MRLYFDECCSKRMSIELKAFFAVDYPDLETAHILDFYNQGTGDSTWLKALQQDRTWIVITQDLGKDPKKEKLPLICKELGVTHIAFSTCIINAGYTIQKTALVGLWDQILKLPLLPKGTQVRLTQAAKKGGGFRYELRVNNQPMSTVLPDASPLPPSPSEAPPSSEGSQGVLPL